MSRFGGGEGGAAATAGAECAGAGAPTGATAVDAAATAGDAGAAADRVDDNVGTVARDAAGRACGRACVATASGASFAGVGGRLPLNGASLGVELTSGGVGSAAAEGVGALATGASAAVDGGSAFVGSSGGGVNRSPENKLAAIAEPPTANIHQRAGRAWLTIVQEFTQSQQ